MADLVEPSGGGPQDPVRVTLIFGAKDWVGAAPSQVWLEQVELDHETAATVHGVVDEVLRHYPVDGGLVPHSLEARGGRTSWGADSGPYLEIALFVSGVLTDQVLRRMLDAIVGRLRTARGDRAWERWREPLDRDRAVEKARWSVFAAYRPAREALDPTPGPEDHLRVIQESHDRETGRWTIAFRDVHGVVYRVTLSQDAGVPAPAFIERLAAER